MLQTNIPQCAIFLRKMRTQVHICVTQWCTVGCWSGALRDLGDRSIIISTRGRRYAKHINFNQHLPYSNGMKFDVLVSNDCVPLRWITSNHLVEQWNISYLIQFNTVWFSKWHSRSEVRNNTIQLMCSWYSFRIKTALFLRWIGLTLTPVTVCRVHLSAAQFLVIRSPHNFSTLHKIWNFLPQYNMRENKTNLPSNLNYDGKNVSEMSLSSVTFSASQITNFNSLTLRDLDENLGEQFWSNFVNWWLIYFFETAIKW